MSDPSGSPGGGLRPAPHSSLRPRSRSLAAGRPTIHRGEEMATLVTPADAERAFPSANTTKKLRITKLA
jgi:hypothetical protein